MNSPTSLANSRTVAGWAMMAACWSSWRSASFFLLANSASALRVHALGEVRHRVGAGLVGCHHAVLLVLDLGDLVLQGRDSRYLLFVWSAELVRDLVNGCLYVSGGEDVFQHDFQELLVEFLDVNVWQFAACEAIFLAALQT